MKNEYLNGIKKEIARKIMKDFGFCACMDQEHQAVLSLSGDGIGFSITIKDVEAIDRKKMKRWN